MALLTCLPLWASPQECESERKHSSWIICQRNQHECPASDSLPDGDAYSEQVIVLSRHFRRYDLPYTVQELIDTSILITVLATLIVDLLSATVCISIWNTSRCEKFNPNVLTKTSGWMFHLMKPSIRQCLQSSGLSVSSSSIVLSPYYSVRVFFNIVTVATDFAQCPYNISWTTVSFIIWKSFWCKKSKLKVLSITFISNLLHGFNNHMVMNGSIFSNVEMHSVIAPHHVRCQNGFNRTYIIQ